MSNYPIDNITIHCSATRPNQDIGADDIRKWHVQGNGWSDIGYHFVIRRDGSEEVGRPISRIGAHVSGHNQGNIGICLVGGLDMESKPADNFTDEQYESLRQLVSNLLMEFPDATVRGHRDWSPDLDGDGVVESHEWMKACPCFSVAEWMERAIG
jgi:N-acetyl-anhydromuramyl-L-alanine amidase AmpD